MSDEVKRTEANSREIRAIEYAAGLDMQLPSDGGYLKERLKSVPDLWRQYRIAKVAIDKVVEGLYETLPTKTLLRLNRLCTQGEIIFRPKSTLNKSTDTQIVLDKDLKVLINAAMGSKCAFCVKTGKESRKCELRNALMNIVPPDYIDNGLLCDYAVVAANCDLEDYI